MAKKTEVTKPAGQTPTYIEERKQIRRAKLVAKDERIGENFGKANWSKKLIRSFVFLFLHVSYHQYYYHHIGLDDYSSYSTVINWILFDFATSIRFDHLQPQSSSIILSLSSHYILSIDWIIFDRIIPTVAVDD